MARISPITVLDGGTLSPTRNKTTGLRIVGSAQKRGIGTKPSEGSAQKNERGSSRHSPARDELINSIVHGYHATEGCPPLATHWGGYDLAETDWLKRFAERIADNHYESLKAWRTLEKKCDTSWIIEFLYLLTFRGKCRAEQDQDAYHAALAEIGKIIAKYDKLRDDILAVVRHARFSSVMAYMGHDLLEELRRLEQLKKRLENLRNANKKWGSYKRSPRDWYLFRLAVEVTNAAGRSHVKELASLVEAARSANNERSGDMHKHTPQKRIQRWKKFMNAKMIGGLMLFPLGKNAIPSAPEKPAASADTKIPF